eukprot:scaffold277969_cov32-Tisochrysis_lutea.AAC.4
MEGRRWGDGVHQAVEAKEGLTIQPETEVVASVTYQSLFRRFRKLASMSGTALSEQEEFRTVSWHVSPLFCHAKIGLGLA